MVTLTGRTSVIVFQRSGIINGNPASFFMRKSCMFSSLVQPFVYFLLIFIVIFLFKKKKSVLGKGSQTNTSPNKEEGRKLHHKAGMGKWNNLKHGFWDVLLCCFWEHS